MMLSADYMTLNSTFVDTEPQLLELFQSETGLRFFRHISCLTIMIGNLNCNADGRILCRHFLLQVSGREQTFVIFLVCEVSCEVLQCRIFLHVFVPFFLNYTVIFSFFAVIVTYQILFVVMMMFLCIAHICSYCTRSYM